MSSLTYVDTTMATLPLHKCQPESSRLIPSTLSLFFKANDLVTITNLCFNPTYFWQIWSHLLCIKFLNLLGLSLEQFTKYSIKSSLRKVFSNWIRADYLATFVIFCLTSGETENNYITGLAVSACPHTHLDVFRYVLIVHLNFC